VSTVHYNTRTAWGRTGVQYREGLGFKGPMICSPHTKHSQLRTLPVTDPQLRPSDPQLQPSQLQTPALPVTASSYGPPVTDPQLRPSSYGPPVTALPVTDPGPPSYGLQLRTPSYGPPVTDLRPSQLLTLQLWTHPPVTDPQSYGHLYYPGSLKGPHISLKVSVAMGPLKS
jgi:hypothetical protein